MRNQSLRNQVRHWSCGKPEALNINLSCFGQPLRLKDFSVLFTFRPLFKLHIQFIRSITLFHKKRQEIFLEILYLICPLKLKKEQSAFKVWIYFLSFKTKKNLVTNLKQSEILPVIFFWIMKKVSDHFGPMQKHIS